ncbi:MAG: hypothetical protein U9P12_02380 [Verrucomicrobiota bacterium]|nr:hypothetical protein [Verrucomicrobiota bacterium]
MRCAFIHILAALFICGVACARDAALVPSASKLDEYMETGMEVAGVRAPYYDDEGNLKAQLYGGYAKILEGGVADVTNLRIDVFQDRKVFMSVFAPQCFTKIVEEGGKKTLSVYSDGDVLIDMEQMTVSGRGFRFTSEENRFEILHDSKVLVRESARGMKGVEL